MRTTGLLACLLFAPLVACGGSGSGTDVTGDDTPGEDGGVTPPARGFQIVSPEVTIEVGQEITYCYYFRTPNTETMAINKWTSVMTPGSHHLIMFTTGNADKQPVGTISAANCGFGGSGTAIPSWTYSAQTPNAELQLPSDDGAGVPLGVEIPPNSAGFVQMHYLNATDNPIKAHITINAEALPAGTAFTKTAAFVTYNASINIPSPSTNFPQEKSCNAPAGAKFWLMSTHAHKQAVKTEVLDGSSMTFMSTDWEHPDAQLWMTAPFYSFASGKVTYRCTYNNTTGRTITSGDSAATDEMCMASGYYFPATKPLLCVDNAGPF